MCYVVDVLPRRIQHSPLIAVDAAASVLFSALLGAALHELMEIGPLTRPKRD